MWEPAYLFMRTCEPESLEEVFERARGDLIVTYCNRDWFDFFHEDREPEVTEYTPGETSVEEIPQKNALNFDATERYAPDEEGLILKFSVHVKPGDYLFDAPTA